MRKCRSAIDGADNCHAHQTPEECISCVLSCTNQLSDVSCTRHLCSFLYCNTVTTESSKSYTVYVVLKSSTKIKHPAGAQFSAIHARFHPSMDVGASCIFLFFSRGTFSQLMMRLSRKYCGVLFQSLWDYSENTEVLRSCRPVTIARGYFFFSSHGKCTKQQPHTCTLVNWTVSVWQRFESLGRIFLLSCTRCRDEMKNHNVGVSQNCFCRTM